MGRRLPAQLLDSVQVILVRVSLAELRREPFHAPSRRSRFLLKVVGDQIGSSILSPMNHLTQSVNGLRTVRRSSITWPSWKSSE